MQVPLKIVEGLVQANSRKVCEALGSHIQPLGYVAVRACRVSAYVSLEQHAIALVVLDARHKKSVPNPTLLSNIVVDCDPAQTKGICGLSAAYHVSTQKVRSALLLLAITR